MLAGQGRRGGRALMGSWGPTVMGQSVDLSGNLGEKDVSGERSLSMARIGTRAAPDELLRAPCMADRRSETIMVKRVSAEGMREVVSDRTSGA